MFFKNSQIYIINNSLYEAIILYFYKNMANKQKLFIFIPYMQKCIFKINSYTAKIDNHFIL